MYTQVKVNCLKEGRTHLRKDGSPNFDSRRTISRKNIWRPQVAQKGAALYEALQKHQSVNIRQISQNRAEQVGYYRFLENENVTLSELAGLRQFFLPKRGESHVSREVRYLEDEQLKKNLIVVSGKDSKRLSLSIYLSSFEKCYKKLKAKS